MGQLPPCSYFSLPNVILFLFSLFSFACALESSEIAESLKKEGKDSIIIFSYGSLLNDDSAKKTLSEKSISTQKLALAFGVKRLFNRDVPILPRSHWGEPVNEYARGMLNVIPTENQYDIVNGKIFTLPLEELEALCRREKGYELIPVNCVVWEESLSKEEPHFFLAYTFSAKGSYVSSEIFPRPGYYEMTRDAAKEHSLLFYYLWMITTYMADGKHLIIDWERAVQEGRDETLIFYEESRIPRE